MDPMTHTLVGGCAAALPAARRRLLPAALLLGANLPDVDGVAYLWGADTAFALRRGLSHGLPAVAVWPWVLTGLLLAWDRLCPARSGERARAAPLLAASFLAVASHPLLDWLNTYGVRLLAPFSDRWYYGDALFIIDPWLWLMLGGGLFLARPWGRSATAGWILLAALASVPLLAADRMVPAAARAVWVLGLAGLAALRLIGAAGAVADRRARSAAVGLALALIYITGMVGMADAARARVMAEFARLDVGPVRDLMVGPRPARPLSHDVLADLGGSYRHGVYEWSRSPALTLSAAEIRKGLNTPPAARALAEPAVQGTLRWMRYPFAVTEPQPDGDRVFVMDARYVRWKSRGFGSVMVQVPREAAR